jgi:IclR family acetate operon transcriptional repressor
VLQRFNPQTITDPGALKTDLAQVRARGWALDDEEKAAGMRCVAAPIVDIHGEAVAGISVSGPTQRMPPARIEEIGALVRGAAAEVSRGLGAPLSD